MILRLIRVIDQIKKNEKISNRIPFTKSYFPLCSWKQIEFPIKITESYNFVLLYVTEFLERYFYPSKVNSPEYWSSSNRNKIFKPPNQILENNQNRDLEQDE